MQGYFFILILLASLVYLWKIGALEWAPESRTRFAQKQGHAYHK